MPRPSIHSKRLDPAQSLYRWQAGIAVVLWLQVIVTTGIITATRFGDGYSTLLRESTVENSLYETGSVLALVLLAGLAAVVSCKSLTLFPWEQWLLRGLALLAIVGAGEEISWGQQWLDFASGDFFRTHNLQEETNVHNLVPATIFSAVINVTIYGVFVALPLLQHWWPRFALFQWLDRHKLSLWLPSFQVGLFVLYASSLHAWFLLQTLSDSAALVGALIAYGATLAVGKGITRDRQRLLFGEWTLVLALTAYHAHSHEIFQFTNMQYEIRECVTVWALCYWLLESVRRCQERL